MSAGVSRLLLSLALLVLAQTAAFAADLPGWSRVRWGMTSAEIARLYGGRAVKLDGRIDFDRLYTDVVLRGEPFAGYDFTVYFQMDNETGRLAQVLLERRRQYATLQAWRDVVAALERSFGTPAVHCNRRGDPLAGEPEIKERVWTLPTTTVRASYIDFGVGQSSRLSRRLLIRHAPTSSDQAACP